MVLCEKPNDVGLKGGITWGIRRGTRNEYLVNFYFILSK